jgi:hypothetical protein
LVLDARHSAKEPRAKNVRRSAGRGYSKAQIGPNGPHGLIGKLRRQRRKEKKMEANLRQ